MDESTQQNAAMAEETSAVAASMASQAKELIQLISLFKIDERGQTQQFHSPAPTTSRDAPSDEPYRQVA
jgi:hypothetical protein